MKKKRNPRMPGSKRTGKKPPKHLRRPSHLDKKGLKAEASSNRRAQEKRGIEKIKKGEEDAPLPETNAEAADRWSFD